MNLPEVSLPRVFGLVLAASLTAAGSTVALADRSPTAAPLARSTIATPFGDVPIDSLVVGDLVWTTDPDGTAVVAPILRIESWEVSPDELVPRVVLSDGRVFETTPTQRTADGQSLGDLGVGSELDGATVVAFEWVRRPAHTTWELLPAGDTGAYWRSGVLLGTVLQPMPVSDRVSLGDGC